MHWCCKTSCKTGLIGHVNLSGTLKPKTLVALKNFPKIIIS